MFSSSRFHIYALNYTVVRFPQSNHQTNGKSLPVKTVNIPLSSTQQRQYATTLTYYIRKNYTLNNVFITKKQLSQ